MANNEPYPAFLDLRSRRALVVGGGEVATRKAKTLLRSGAQITVVSPVVSESLEQMEEDGAVVIERRAFAVSDAVDCTLVFAATGVPEVDAAVAQAARSAGALANLAADADGCDFLVPASGTRGAIQIAVGTAGTSPGLGVRLRDRVIAALGPEWEEFAELLGQMRSVAHDAIPDAGTRQRALARAANDDGLLAAVARGEKVDPKETLLGMAESAFDAVSSGDAAEVPGGAFVSLVGAGPGSPGLLTLLGHERVSSADVIVYDDLVDSRVLSAARDDAELIYAGKRGWREGPARPDTGELLVAKAREGRGKRVVRLKGGDPMVFGRAGEEMATLEAAGLPCEVIPGVTAALAAAAGAKIPLTLRGVSNSVTFVAGNSAVESPAAATGLGELTGASGPPVESLASAALSGGTLCIYMGLKGLREIGTGLISRGVDAELPVAVVEGASSESQRCVRGTLATVAEAVEAAEIASPALVIVGRVVDYSPDGGREGWQ